ncbi:MAG: histidine--tRNA ligase [Thermoplasmatota archaeon]
MPKIQRPPGTRDFSPDEMARRRAAERIFRDAFERFAYREIQTPTFESLELFTLKSGPGVVGELYDFVDKGGRPMTLRPELTAPVLRYFVNELSREPKPLKLYYFGNCFRYENAQSGRWREFWQFGTEIIGPATAEADAETIGLAAATLLELGFTAGQFRIRIGHVGILRALLAALAAPEDAKSEMYRLIDKKNLEGLREKLAANSALATPAGRLLLSIVERQYDVSLAETAAAPAWAGLRDEALALYATDAARQAPIRQAFAALEDTLRFLSGYGVDRIAVDLGVARGLDYYTGMVFEIEVPDLGAEKQVVGGGAYSLSELFGGEPTGSVGFGMGFDRILLAMERIGIPVRTDGSLLAVVVPIGDAQRLEAVRLARDLRAGRLRVDLELSRRKPAKALEWAHGRGIPFVVLLGEKEAAKGVVTVRNMESGEQVEVARADLVTHMTRLASGLPLAPPPAAPKAS